MNTTQTSQIYDIKRDIFPFDIFGLSKENREFVEKLYHLVRQIKGGSTWYKGWYYFFVSWKMQNKKPKILNIHGYVRGENYDDEIPYIINFHEKGMIYILNGEEHQKIPEKLQTMLRDIVEVKKRDLEKSEKFFMKFEKKYDLHYSVFGLMNDIWNAAMNDQLDHVVVSWDANQYKNPVRFQIHEIYDKEKEKEFKLSCDPYFVLERFDIQRKYIFTTSPKYTYCKISIGDSKKDYCSCFCEDIHGKYHMNDICAKECFDYLRKKLNL